MNEGIGFALLLDNWHNYSGDDHILEVNRFELDLYQALQVN